MEHIPLTNHCALPKSGALHNETSTSAGGMLNREKPLQHPSRRKEKIRGSDFKIRATNFKIQGKYFLPRQTCMARRFRRLLKFSITIVKSARTTAKSTCSAAPSANTTIPSAPTAAQTYYPAPCCRHTRRPYSAGYSTVTRAGCAKAAIFHSNYNTKKN